MIYCYQRPCAVFSVDLTDWLLGECKDDDLVKHECLTPDLTNARSPRFSPDGKIMVFIGRSSVYGVTMAVSHFML